MTRSANRCGGWCAWALAVLAVAGCQGLVQAPAAPRSYDLGATPASVPPSALIAGVQVSAPAWLRTPAIQYRFSQVDPRERRAYRDHRWAAPPGELMLARLQRDLVVGGRCRLEVNVDEFIQEFPAAEESFGVVAVRATLRSAEEGAPLARHSFAYRVPAPRPDAPGGVDALARAVGQFSSELQGWVTQVGTPPEISRPCQRQ